VIAAALLAACAKSPEAKAGLGRQVHAGAARALAASADGQALSFLDGCEEVRARFLPPQTARCDLRVVPAGGGEARKVAAGVTTLPHGVAWSPDGAALVALADHDVASASGTLVLFRGGAARPLAERVTFHGFGARGELGIVAAGRLLVLRPSDDAPREVAGADQVATFDLAAVEPPGCDAGGRTAFRLAARRTYAAGGQLLVSDCRLAEARPLERGQVGEYAFAPTAAAFAYTVQGKGGAALKVVRGGGAAAPEELGEGAQAFAFGPDGSALAFIAGAAPGRQGDLRLAVPGRAPVVLGREVGEFRWARAAPRLAWLERYDPRVRAGTLGGGGPDLAPRTYATNVSELDVSADGKHVAFLQHTTRGGYSVDLGLARLDAPAGEAPATVARGVFGFSFSPDGRWLYYRTRCVRNAEACDLERVPASGLAAGEKPEAIAPGVKSFEFDPRDPERLLLGWQRMDMVALDVGVWEKGRVTRVDDAVLPGSARFLGPDSRRLAYVVAAPKRAGVYVAELPR
jgi:hypothetical protein